MKKHGKIIKEVINKDLEINNLNKNMIMVKIVGERNY